MAMLTHELRSPLSAVDTQMHVVLKGLAGDLTPKQKDMLGRMKLRIQGVLGMINDLLDLSKIESRQMVRDKAPIDITPIVRETIDMFGAQAREKQLSLSFDPADALPPVMADAAAFRNVSTNLVGNALRYTPQGGTVNVVTRVDGGWVVFEVADSGIGISGENHERIFEKVFPGQGPAGPACGRDRPGPAHCQSHYRGSPGRGDGRQ